MSPFDLRGPAFLLFYWVLGAAVFAALAWLRHRRESGPVPRLKAVDPYVVAHLRGGEEEAIKLVVLSLVDRGLLVAADDRVTAVDGAQEKVQRPLERRILEAAARGTTGRALLRDPRVREACAALGAHLRAQKMLPSEDQRAHRWLLGIGAIALLWSVALVKIGVALARGRPNVGLLILSTLASALIVAKVLGRRRTALGDAFLADLRALFAGLRAQPLRGGGETNEAALLAAVFGFSTVAVGAWAAAGALFPQPPSDRKGSSCSSGASCGGGCGGGCGGCGG